MRNFLRNNRSALGLYGALLFTALFFIVSYGKHDIHLYINSFVGDRSVNAFFYVADHLGDGFMAPVLVFAVAAVNVRAGLYTACALLAASGITTALKYWAFDDVHRPYFIFQYFDRHTLNLVEGVHVNIHNSFPSGHATQTFAIFMSMIFYARKQAFKHLFLLTAVIGAFSRVYLSQHWLVDIVAGSVIGTLCSLVFYSVFIKEGRLEVINKPLKDLFPRGKT